MSHILLDDISKRFGEVTALKGVELEFLPGKIVGLTGPSGAGKSSLCRIISGIDRPDTGRVVANGHDVTDLPPTERRTAFMFESFALYPHMKVFNNIAFPLRAPARSLRLDTQEIAHRVKELTELVEISDLVDRYPSELSGGQKQRAALARALLVQPAILLLDDSLSSVDTQTEKEILTELGVATNSITTLVVAQRISSILHADRIYVLEDGRIAEEGSHAELIETNGLYAETYRLQLLSDELEGM